MSDYTQVTDFSAKDALSSGDPEKLILGSDIDGELTAIASAITSKYDSNDLASQAQAEAETDNTVLMTPLRLAQWSDANGGMVGDIHALADPGADQLLGWDNSATAVIGWTFSGSGLAFGDGTIGVEAGLEAIAGLSKTDGNIIVGNGSTWVAESGATARTSLGLAIGSDVQAYNADLAAIAALAKTDGNFIVGNGSAWVAESGATARASLGVSYSTDDEALAAGATTVITPANLHATYLYLAGFAASNSTATYSDMTWYVNNDTFDNDFYLAEGKYIIEGVIVNGNGNGTPDLNLQLEQGTDGTAEIDSCISSWRSWSPNTPSLTDIGYVNDATLPHTMGTVITHDAGNTDGYQCAFQIFIRVTTGGQFKMQYACETAGVATQILYSTYMKITRCDTTVP
jgi:hypothetical protein